MVGTAADALLFENEDWLVTDSGLEHKHTGYFIGRDSLGDRRADGLWSWPLHMAEKQWCTLAPFAEAFARAASVHGARLDPDLARSFRAARFDIAGAPNSLADAPILLPDALRDERPAPISWKPRRAAEWPWNGGERRTGSAQFLPSPEARDRGATPVRKRASIRVIAAWRWRAPRPFRSASTQLVRLLQTAFSRA